MTSRTDVIRRREPGSQCNSQYSQRRDPIYSRQKWTLGYSTFPLLVEKIISSVLPRFNWTNNNTGNNNTTICKAPNISVDITRAPYRQSGNVVRDSSSETSLWLWVIWLYKQMGFQALCQMLARSGHRDIASKSKQNVTYWHSHTSSSVNLSHPCTWVSGRNGDVGLRIVSRGLYNKVILFCSQIFL